MWGAGWGGPGCGVFTEPVRVWQRVRLARNQQVGDQTPSPPPRITPLHRGGGGGREGKLAVDANGKLPPAAAEGTAQVPEAHLRAHACVASFEILKYIYIFMLLIIYN